MQASAAFSRAGALHSEIAPDGMEQRRIKRIAIVGGGTAGWMAASTLARILHGSDCTITLVESPDIATVGVGEATIPPILDFLRFLGIDQNDFVDRTQATYKLAIRFKDWRTIGHDFWHPFGAFGVAIDRVPFTHFWHKLKTKGFTPRMEHFSLEASMARAHRFIFPGNTLGIGGGLKYALHFDAALVARYLRAYAERLGVKRIEKSVAGATVRHDGFIDELVFSDGERLQAQLYIDCSGFRGLLIEETLRTGYVKWTDLLPCDRAVVMPTALPGSRAPYTLATARPAGWQWRIPLQHRMGNGYVYSSAHISDERALDDLKAMVGAEPLAEPRLLQFVTGRRRVFWNRNCVALGLASGFLEPLESTSIHLIVSGLYNLLDHFPQATFDPDNIADYNAQLIEEFERVRDFIILHYCGTQRTDSPLWRQCQNIALPDSLADRIALYRGTGRVFQKRFELFSDLSWFFVLDGMGYEPRDYDPLADVSDFDQVKRILSDVSRKIAADAAAAPTHDSFFRAKPGGGTAVRLR
jgi:tryptophan 7-halogenase